MKVLLLIVSIFTVSTIVDCHQYIVGGADGQEEHFADKGLDYSNVDQELEATPLVTKEKRQHESKVRRLRCKARNACVVMGGFCVTNSTHCSGRLVPEGCKGINCQCCVPGTLELKIRNMEMELQSFRSNLTADNSELKIELQNMKYENNNTNFELKNELKSMKNNITNGNAIQVSKLDSIREQQGCSDGFLFSTQCFKLFTDLKRSWTSARTKCQSEGLILAEPSDSIAVPLRKYLLDNYVGKVTDNGDHQMWIGARGDGVKYVWQHSRATLRSDSPLWNQGPGSSNVGTDKCVEFDVYMSEWDAKPAEPYDSMSCSTARLPLCEVIRG